MKTKTIALYEFVELSDKAKEAARDWWRECEGQEFGDHQDLYESVELAAKLLGITFKQNPVRMLNGKMRYEPEISWQLHVQGSGASFAGEYEYAKGSTKAIAEEFPKDEELNRIARELASLQKQFGYRLKASITRRGSSAHSYSMEADVWHGLKCIGDGDVLDLMRAFANWIYVGINAEWENRMSNEYIDDAMIANGYTFTVDGKREDI